MNGRTHHFDRILKSKYENQHKKYSNQIEKMKNIHGLMHLLDMNQIYF
jgi:hypothetical protein